MYLLCHGRGQVAPSAVPGHADPRGVHPVLGQDLALEEELGHRVRVFKRDGETVLRGQPVAGGGKRSVLVPAVDKEGGLLAYPCWGMFISVPREVGTVYPRGSTLLPTHLYKAKIATNHNSPLSPWQPLFINLYKSAGKHVTKYRNIENQIN